MAAPSIVRYGTRVFTPSVSGLGSAEVDVAFDVFRPDHLAANGAVLAMIVLRTEEGVHGDAAVEVVLVRTVHE